MKKSILIILTFIFLVNIGGYILIYPLFSNYYKNIGMQKAENPEEDELIELIILKKNDIDNNKINFKWIHSREFKLNDEMYDIVKQNEDDEHYYFYCINDKKEKEFDKKFENKMNENTSNNKNTQNQQQNILISTVPIAYTLNYIKTKKEFSINLIFMNNYNSIKTEVITPPPQIV